MSCHTTEIDPEKIWVSKILLWKRPFDASENKKVAATNERRCQRALRALYSKLVVPVPHRLKPSRQVPNEPLEHLRGAFQFVDAFIPDEHIGKVIRAMGWVLFPEEDTYVDSLCALLPEGSHEKDARRVLLLFQDFWIWLDKHPEFDKTEFVALDAMPSFRDETALKALQVLLYVPLRAAFAVMDSLKSWISSHAEQIERQTGGMLTQLKILAMMWLVEKQEKQLKKLREEEHRT